MAEVAATLVVGPSWVGDMVMAQALFKTLKQDAPGRSVDVLAPAWSLPVVARMPEVRKGIASETGHGEVGIGKRRHIGKSLRGQYDRAIVLPRSLKAALIPWFARIPVRTGYRGESRYLLINDMRPFDQAVLDQTVKRFVALGTPATSPEVPVTVFPELRVDAENQERLASELGLDTSLPVVGFMPGAEYGPAKCWPLASFSALASELRAAGFAVWVMGSDKDRAAGDAIAAGTGAINLCGKTSLADVIDLLAMCGQVVSNDSGLMHIAAAAGCHVHGIYGSSSPRFTPPLTARRDIHYLGLDCSPCFQRQCPLEHLNCLNQIEPAALLASIERAAG
ncbi:MAG: lipopolysaccharide heptosyltransferase II [Pseudomonadota bacterium]